jgi:hypothetical protein
VSTQQNAHFKLEKRVKSRFSQRVIRVTSPLAGNIAQNGHWKRIVKDALCPWHQPSESAPSTDGDLSNWIRCWESDVNVSGLVQGYS